MLSGWHVGISSVGVPIAALLAREATDPLARALTTWAATRKLDMLLVMTGSTTASGQYARELGIWAATPDAKQLLPAVVRACDPLCVESGAQLTRVGCASPSPCHGACVRAATGEGVAGEWGATAGGVAPLAGLAAAGMCVAAEQPEGVSQDGAADDGVHFGEAPTRLKE
jgi:hypothetical protein